MIDTMAIVLIITVTKKMVEADGSSDPIEDPMVDQSIPDLTRNLCTTEFQGDQEDQYHQDQMDQFMTIIFQEVELVAVEEEQGDTEVEAKAEVDTEVEAKVEAEEDTEVEV